MGDEYDEAVSGTALHHAVRNRHAAVAARLIEKGLSVETEDCNGRTPLHVVESGECATLLLDYGADIEALDGDMDTPLIRAASWDMPDVMGVLIARRARLDTTNAFGATALYEACDCVRVSIALLLLEAGADANRGEHYISGRRALHAMLIPFFSQVRSAPLLARAFSTCCSLALARAAAKL
jgi:ankyrin repeat protein